MEKRVKVDKHTLARVQSDLKDKGYTIDEINSKIGSNFRNFRYKGHSMPIEAFQNLRELAGGNLKGSEIQYIDGKGESKNLNIEKSCAVAELTGIMLGDGYLQSSIKEREDRITSAHRALITLHSDEKHLRDGVLDLLENLANKEPKIHRLKSSKAIQIIVNSKEFVRELQQIGLKAGDKVENQVEVPAWVTKDKKYEKCCLRGLVDTDGTIYRQSTDERVIIQFKNHSDPLLEGFRRMCADLDIEASNAGKHAVQVAKQEDVKKFIEKVEPLKASNIDF